MIVTLHPNKSESIKYKWLTACVGAVAHFEQDNTSSVKTKGTTMLSYAITFLIIAIIAGVFGFVGVAGLATEIAKILFFVFLVLFIVSLVAGRRPPV